MNKYRNVLWLLCLIAGLSSCEMRDELFGRFDTEENAGALELDLSSMYNGIKISRADGTTDNGEVEGDFDEEDINIDNYTLIVTNTDTEEEVTKGLVSELKNESGKVILPLGEGNYSVKAYNYEGENVTVSNRPYFKDERNFTVKKGVSTNVELACKLACVETKLGVTQSFTDAFLDDYVVTIDNGNGAGQTFDKSNLGEKYYFKTPENGSTLHVSVKATSKEENFIELKAAIEKPADADGGVADLEDGDSFLINLTEAGATDSYLSIGITVDLTFTEVGETIKIPVENITYDGPEVPEPEDPSTPGDSNDGEGGTLTVTGIPETYNLDLSDMVGGKAEMPTIVVNMSSENGIKSLKVAIKSDNPTFPILLGGMDLDTPFDMCNLEDRQEAKEQLISLSLITEESYTNLHAGTVKDYTFNVTKLVALLPEQQLFGKHVFTLTISDGYNTKSGELVVNVTE